MIELQNFSLELRSVFEYFQRIFFGIVRTCVTAELSAKTVAISISPISQLLHVPSRFPVLSLFGQPPRHKHKAESR